MDLCGSCKNPRFVAAGDRIDYEAAVSGGLQLVPTGSALKVLADDYARMVADGMLLGTDESFERLIERCAGIEARAEKPEDDNGSVSRTGTAGLSVGGQDPI